VKSDPVPVLAAVAGNEALGLGVAISSKSGSMVYVPSAGASMSTLVAVDRSGRERTLLTRTDRYAGPRWSPDGKRVLVYTDVPKPDVWMLDLASSTSTQLTRGSSAFRPAWSPDGSHVVYSTDEGAMVMPTDGSRPPSRVYKGGEPVGGAVDWTADGKWIIKDGDFSGPPRSQKEDVYAIPADGRGEMRAAVSGTGMDELGTVSPDSKWIAYNSDESERYKIYVRPFLAEGGKFLISDGGGIQPRWISNHEVAYLDENLMLTVAELKIGSAVEVVKRSRLFSAVLLARRSPSNWTYDVSRDGKEFLFAKGVGASNVSQPTVVLHWAQEVAKKIREQGNAR
jgi:hypothetical protein